MEELKLLIGMVADLPKMAIWVLLGYLIFKLFIIGSVYGVIKLFILKLHSWLTTPKHELVTKDETTRVSSLVIENCFDDLIAQLHRIRVTGSGVNYIHAGDVQWLRRAIDTQQALDTEGR